MIDYENGAYISRFAFWNPATWSIPALYWDTMSQEQRYHAICRQLSKVIQYADYLGVNVDDIAGRLEAIEKGELDEFIKAEIEAWFEDNEPAIMAAIDALEDALPISEFDSTDTVKKRFEAIEDVLPLASFDSVNTVESRITGIEDVLPINSFNDSDTVAAALTDLASLLPYSAFNDVNTVDARFDVIEANNWVTTNRITDANVTTAKIADDAITTAKIADANVTTAKLADGAITTAKINDGAVTNAKLSQKKLLLFGDSWVTNDNNTWPDDLAAALDMTLVDYAEGGTGWSFGTNNMQNQITNASADSEAEIIIAMSGINDVRQSVSYNDYKNAVQAACAQLRTKYPQARIYVIPMNIPSKGHASTGTAIQDYYYRIFTDISLQSSAVAMVDIGAWLQPLAPYNIWTGDDLHMNNYGNTVFLNFMYSIINGSTLTSTRMYHELTPETGVTVYGDGLVIINGIVQMDIRGLTIPSTNAGSTINIGHFGWWSTDKCPWYARVAVDSEYVPCFAMSGAGYVGFLEIKQDGSVTFTAAANCSGNIAPIVHSWHVV